MTVITHLQTLPIRVLGWRWRSKYNRWFFEYGPRPQGYRGKRRRTAHQGATMQSPLYADIMPTQGVLREDEATDAMAYIEAEAERLCREAAARGNDTSDDVLGGIDPEIHKANKPLFAAMFADFDAAYNAIVDRFNNEPQAPRRVLVAAEETAQYALADLQALLAETALVA